VEFFFFDENTGVLPMPANETSAAGSLEYPAWLAKAEIEDLTTEAGLKEVTFVEMHDALFRTNSAVVLPEGEDPNSKPGGGRALTSVGLFATALRYNEENPSHVDAQGNEVRKKFLITGHTDTKGSDPFNQPLSEERAKVALALLTGGAQGRKDFAKLCQARHDGIDLTQIFHWVADSPDFEFQCKPTLWDQPPSTTTVTHFKQEYNRTFEEKFADMDGAVPFTAVNGTEDAAMWSAIFDCYEHGLRCELGDMENSKEGKDELDRLRKLVTWVDPSCQTMGFGERFPVDNIAKSDFRSQSNRRVEVMMFDEGEEPDLAEAQADPEMMETYLPGAYALNPVKPMVSARPWKAEWEHKFDPTSAKSMPTRMGEVRKMILLATGLPAGTEMTFSVSMVGYDFERKLPCLSNENGVKVPFSGWNAPDVAPPFQELKAVEAFPVAQFSFAATGGGRTVRAKAPLPYEDTIAVQLAYWDDEGKEQILSNRECTVSSPWGRRSGETDNQGVLRQSGLPPGGISLATGRVVLVEGGNQLKSLSQGAT
jgi:hypothetical protein